MRHELAEPPLDNGAYLDALKQARVVPSIAAAASGRGPTVDFFGALPPPKFKMSSAPATFSSSFRPDAQSR